VAVQLFDHGVDYLASNSNYPPRTNPLNPQFSRFQYIPGIHIQDNSGRIIISIYNFISIYQFFISLGFPVVFTLLTKFPAAVSQIEEGTPTTGNTIPIDLQIAYLLVALSLVPYVVWPVLYVSCLPDRNLSFSPSWRRVRGEVFQISVAPIPLAPFRTAAKQ
jgi:hypothetical protein